jgi:hypothetical protein
MKEFLKAQEAPELVFGLVAPIGVDLDLVTSALAQSLRDVRYTTEHFKLTDLMLELELDKPPSKNGSVESYRERIAYANAVRKKLGNEALAALAISAIRSFRNSCWAERSKDEPPARSNPHQKSRKRRRCPAKPTSFAN